MFIGIDLRARAAACLMIAACFATPLIAQPPTAPARSPFPIDVRAGPPPRPFMAGDRTRLVYELHIVNALPWAIAVTGLDVDGADGARIARLDETALDRDMLPAERLVVSGDAPSGSRALGPGHAAVIFCDLTLAPGAATPSALVHRLSFSFANDRGETVSRAIGHIEVPVAGGAVPVLASPFRGGRWIAFNGLFAPNHRRAYNAVNGRIRIAERFAVDWMMIGPDGRLARPGGHANADFYGYGEPVLAVADGRIVDGRDDMAENEGESARADRHVTLDSAVGNYATLDIGGGRYALYAHLQPGSLRVGIGQQVHAGDVIALLGNSGNSDAPHLHLQVMDANSPLGAEGVPYVFAHFGQLGVADADRLDAGAPWRPAPGAHPIEQRNEFPLDNAVEAFP